VNDAERVYRARPTSEEIEEVLGQRLVATVGTLNEDGSIHLAFVIFLHEGGRMYFETSSVTRKARNAEGRGWASMIVQGPAASGRSLMVSAEGRATVLHGAESSAINHRLGEIHRARGAGRRGPGMGRDRRHHGGDRTDEMALVDRIRSA
jgi:hypothetical protein